MKIFWSDFAKEMLKDIYIYHKNEASINIARRIRDDIFSSVKQLVNHPNSGQVEETLKTLNKEYRYLISGNYKIIYTQIENKILITDVFDTRQNPIKINNPYRNK